MCAQDQPMRIGIVGAGSISKLHLEAVARHPERMCVVADPASGETLHSFNDLIRLSQLETERMRRNR